MIDSNDFLKFAVRTAKKAGQLQMPFFGNISSLKRKTNNIDLLTDADTESEKFIIREIQKKYPEHSILSEEAGFINKKSSYTWVIDPLDGTTNFANNLPIFAVSIGLQENNKTICGVVYNPAANKCFYAEKDKGAYLNNKRIHVNSSNTLSNSLLATGFPYSHDKYYNQSFFIFKDFYDRTQGIRRLGAAALDLCFVAMGRFAGFYEFNLNPWDICAGALIAKEAGGICTDWNNKALPDSGARILCSNERIHKEMVKILSNSKYRLFYDLK